MYIYIKDIYIYIYTSKTYVYIYICQTMIINFYIYIYTHTHTMQYMYVANGSSELAMDHLQSFLQCFADSAGDDSTDAESSERV